MKLILWADDQRINFEESANGCMFGSSDKANYLYRFKR